ncbi:zinc ABC transporter ATP-binding protein AztA [Nocardia cyriacigeorgica]|uniref:Iron(3+)-hydroxamate import ATP-binding protein FhuC n=1 Tax=Nocardia cyriacigeorgica TaxID=135487 RepID=A0A4V6ICJ3_9NOCA|nr:zinc ABC transporter ATP-binding protein AztA [Nocardia cyriacigeorgica]VFA99203.1 Iron(3+)-hydroxamate import ATP-binding protein FhuC [Nocardia cyriacigeorgica]
MQTPDIRLAGLSAGYRGNRVLHEVTATLPNGKVTALLGPNGSGKSTLLAALAGVVPLLAGTIAGRDGLRPALVVQQSAVPATLPITVRETVAMGRWAHRGPWRRLTGADQAIIGECLDRLAITGLADRRLDTLSGGQRQRALLAQALAQQSQLLLLDEPTTGLDLEAREQITSAIAEVSAAGVTVVHATHDLDDALRADHCVHLRGGRVVSEGEPRTALLARSS